jgi:N-formylglutamate deformylase
MLPRGSAGSMSAKWPSRSPTERRNQLSVYKLKRGTSPVILGLPHTGTALPDSVAARLNENGRKLADTDWHIEHLFEGLLPGASVVRALFHRYVIDANRDPEGKSLYPGQNTTGLVPDTDFDGAPIWLDGAAPHGAEVERRRSAFHEPYHEALAAEIERMKALHGVVILLDCHSIRSHIPFLFEGKLPDLNIGTNGGVTCAPAVERAVVDIAGRSAFTFVLNGRFKGGWTTRHYGRPRERVHAIQLEIAQSAYLATEAAPFAYCEDKAAVLRDTLRAMLTELEVVAKSL